MHSSYANCLVKAETFDSAVTVALFMFTYKINGAFNCHKTFDSFSSDITAGINSFKLIDI